MMVETEFCINIFNMPKEKWPEEWSKKVNPFNYKYFSEPLDDKIIQDKIKFNSKKRTRI